MSSITVESFKFEGANFHELLVFFAYSWGCSFVGASVFSFNKKE